MQRLSLIAGAVGSLAVVAVLADVPFAALDAALLKAAHEVRRPFGDVFFLVVTWLGSLWVLVPASLVYALWLSARISFPAFCFVPVAVLGTALLSHALKATVDRGRPNLYQTLTAVPEDASFPSAHAAQTLAAGLALLLQPGIVLSRRLAFAIAAVGSGSVLAVGISRVYLQVHFASDVAAGVLTGLAVVLALRRLPLWEGEHR